MTPLGFVILQQRFSWWNWGRNWGLLHAHLYTYHDGTTVLWITYSTTRFYPLPNFFPATVDAIIVNLARENIVTTMTTARAALLDAAGFVAASDYIYVRIPDSTQEFIGATVTDVVISDREFVSPSYAAYKTLAAILAAGGIYFTTADYMEVAVTRLYNALDTSSRDLLNYQANNVVYVDDYTNATKWTAATLCQIWSRAERLFYPHVVDADGRQLIEIVWTTVTGLPPSFHVGNYVGAHSTIPVINMELIPRYSNSLDRTIGVSVSSYMDALISIIPDVLLVEAYRFTASVRIDYRNMQRIGIYQNGERLLDTLRAPLEIDGVTIVPVGFMQLYGSDNLYHAALQTNRFLGFGCVELLISSVLWWPSLRHEFTFIPNTTITTNIVTGNLATANIVTTMETARMVLWETAGIGSTIDNILLWFPDSARELINATVACVIITDADDASRIIGLVRYPSPINSSRDYTATFIFDEAYFFQSANEYNPSLATMSLLFQLSSWGSNDVNDYRYKMRNAENLMADLGFVGFEHNFLDSDNDIPGKPSKDSIGAVAAHRVVSADDELTGDTREYTLIALAIRGGGYESEWASNFKMGISGYHAGFYQASNIVARFLRDYIDDQGITGDIKLWLTGFSRAGAVANLLAGGINSGRIALPSQVTLESHNFFTYTFATPAGVLRQDAVRFGNIFNIIHTSDPVPLVAPIYWEFARYGIDWELPNPETVCPCYFSPLHNRMLFHFNSLESVSANNIRYQLNDFTMMRIRLRAILPGGNQVIQPDIHNAQPQNVFLHDYVTMLARDVLQTREIYVTFLQDDMRYFAGMIFGATPYQMEIFLEEITNQVLSGWRWLIWDVFRKFGGLDTAYARVVQWLRESLEVSGIEYTHQEFDAAVELLMDLLVVVAFNHPNRATTLVYNIGSIGQAHHPEIYLAWLKSMDPNFETGGVVNPWFSPGRFRIIRINCPVDVRVYLNNRLVAAIIDDIPQQVTSIITAINEDGEKLIFLPATEEYNIVLTATGDDTMTFSVHEFSRQAGGVNRIVNYFDIPIIVGQRFDALISAFSAADLADTTAAASSTVYMLTTGGELILPNEILTGYHATSARYHVNATSADNLQGIAFGSGSRLRGTYAIVTAIPHDGYEFLGWYLDNVTLVSNDAEYRFRVMGDIYLVARFNYANGLRPVDEETVLTIFAGAVAAGGIRPFTSDAGRNHWRFLLRLANRQGFIEDLAAQDEKWHDSIHGTVFHWDFDMELSQALWQPVWSALHRLNSDPNPGNFFYLCHVSTPHFTLLIVSAEGEQRMFALDHANFMTNLIGTSNRVRQRSGSDSDIFIRWEPSLDQLPMFMFADLVVPVYEVLN